MWPLQVAVIVTLLVPILCQSPCQSLCKCLTSGEVYCNRTGIIAVPRGLPVNLTLLDLSDNPIKFIPKMALIGLNSMTSLTINRNGFTDASIATGALDLPKLTDIDLSTNSYKVIPSCLPRKTTTFRLFQNKLTTLTANSFLNHSALTYVDLSNNVLHTIEEHAFDPLVNMSTVYLSFNNLTDTSFPTGAFSKTQRLSLLSLRFNQLSSLLKDLPVSIQGLDYVGNQIKTLPSFAFANLTQLHSLSMWQGHVTTIEDNAFFGLNKLALLDFMQDTIQSRFTKDTFNGLTSLGIIYLSLNNVSTIDPMAFRSFGSLTELWMADNKLTRLQPEVLDTKYMPRLNMLFIDSNPWYCDCKLRWLREKMDNATYVIQDPHLIKCAGPTAIAGKSWDNLKPIDFVCP